MKRTLVIGDIHGGLRALKQVLDRADISEDDTLIFLGDYIDGWSESAQTIGFLISLSKRYKCIFIKGNHDVWCEEWLNSDEANPTWLFHGGQATLESYVSISELDRRNHLDFFERMRFFYVDDKNRLFIHAGFTSMKGPNQEFHASNYSWDRTLWEMAVAMDTSMEKHSILYPKRLKLYKEIFIGHTPTLYYDRTWPMQAINVWNMDTGAAFTGRLSVMDVDTKEIWQSDPVQDLYPDEKGRNK